MEPHAQHPALSSDIQLALHHAVGEANSAFVHSAGDYVQKKTKKKRVAEDVDGTRGSLDRIGEGKEKKKKSKKHNNEEHDVTATTGVMGPPVEGTQENNVGGEASKKKSKKDKGRKKSQNQPETVAYDDTAHDPFSAAGQEVLPVISGSDPSTSAFLSAIVTAASATLDPQLPDHVPTHISPPPYNEQHMASVIQQAQASQFMGYPSMNYPYSVYPSSVQHPVLYSQPAGPLPDLTFASNDDILRAIQDLDVTKITSVLKTLGDAAAAANVPLPSLPAFLPVPGSVPEQGHIAPTEPVDPAASASRRPAKRTKPMEHKRTLDMSLPHPEQGVNPRHAHMLATKWMNAGKLAELVRTDGLMYKKGKFSAIEEELLKNAIEDYRRRHGLSEEQLVNVIFAKVARNDENSFWTDITSAVPLRPIIAVYHHVRRGYHPMKQQGKWMPSEDALLRQAVVELGQRWEKVSERVGRMSADCRDRWRNHLSDKDIRAIGHWTRDEEEELTRIVTEMTIQQGKDSDNDVFWGEVSRLMGGRRGRQQCRIKWTDCLSKTVKAAGQKPRWSQQDAFILMHKVDSMNVRDDSEIDWKILPDQDWNLWSAHTLQRRWLTMKRGIKGFEDMTHQEILDILRVKKGQYAGPTANPPRKRKVTSAAVVESEPAPLGEGSSRDYAGSGGGLGVFALGGVRDGDGDEGVADGQDAEGSTDSSG